MIGDFKKSVQLMRYGFQAKLQVVSMVAFLVVGIVMELVTKGTYWLGAYFIIIAPIYFSQLLYGLGMSGIVASSPYKKRLQTSLPAIGNGILGILTLTVLVVLKYFEIQLNPQNTKENIIVLLMVGFMCFILNVYSATVYKYYALSIVFLMAPIMIFSYTFTTSSFDHFEHSFWGTLAGHLNMGSAALVCYLCVVAGALLQYAISCALYKKPLSEYAQGMMMRKYLKG